VDLNHPTETGGFGGGPDLSPRTLTEPTVTPPPARPKRRRWPAALVLALVLIAGAVILFEGLSNATVYFCNANEVGQRADCMPGKRFRVQGTVDTGSVQRDGADTVFTVSYGGATIPVRYQGEPGGIFKEGLPVVVEGRMGTTGTFAGDRVLVKHTEEYRAKNPDRVPSGAP
jgi:cytochrome c-type biogenesis protein CcmE